MTTQLLGVRPQGKIQSALEWWSPGKTYRAETRWFQSGSSEDMTVAGTFTVAPAAGESLLINRVTLLIVDTSGTWSDTTIGSSTAYTGSNGPRLSVRKGGSEVHEFTADIAILNNRDVFMNTSPDYVFQNLDSGNSMCAATWDLVGSHAPVILEATDDDIRFVTGSTIGCVEMSARADCFRIEGD